MLTGISENLQDVSDSRKTAVINNELMRLNVDIATLQETLLADSVVLKERDYTFYWQRKVSGEHREYGVGFAVSNSLLSMIEPGSNGSERLLTLRLNTTAGPVALVSVYFQTVYATSDTKYEFCETLAAIISSVPNNEQLVLLGEFNVREGADHDAWPSCLGQFGVVKMNENGQRLIEPQHKVSRRHPRSKHWHQLDMILFRRAALKNVLHIRSLPQCGLHHRPLIVVLQDQAEPARRCANEYWTQLSHDIQTAAITGNSRGLYDGIKKAIVLPRARRPPSNRLMRRYSQTKSSRWRDGWNTILTSSPERIPCLQQP